MLKILAMVCRQGSQAIVASSHRGIGHRGILARPCQRHNQPWARARSASTPLHYSVLRPPDSSLTRAPRHVIAKRGTSPGRSPLGTSHLSRRLARGLRPEWTSTIASVDHCICKSSLPPYPSLHSSLRPSTFIRNLLAWDRRNAHRLLAA